MLFPVSETNLALLMNPWPFSLQQINAFSNSISMCFEIMLVWKLRFTSLSHIKHAYDVCHEKTDLKIFVIVIPKEGQACVAAPILLVVWHRLLENMIYEVKRLIS